MALNLSAVGEHIGPLIRDYAWKDVVLYALGVGASFDELEYVYEDRLKVLPSFSIAAIFDFLAHVGVKSNADLSGILHGEQDILFHNPIPVEGALTTQGTITHIFDKGEAKGALVVAEADTVHSNGSKLFTNVFTLFCRKDGGFGGDPGPGETFALPDGPPDFRESARPSADQPLLYRLSGDVFALHVDPEFARISGFERPIMHGLCTHGYACRAVIKHLFPGEPERMRRFRVRFSRPLYPGVPLVTEIWKLSKNTAVFRTLNEHTGETILDRGRVDWLDKEEFQARAKRSGIRFDGRVAVVTGAGAGLGRMYALGLAARGARVVVNDLGVSRDGVGTGSELAAERVVREIREAGGEAVPDCHSVSTSEGGQAVVDTALQAFGRIDILINNAGILRDKTLLKMEPENWKAVIDVHLSGAYHVTRPAFLKMKESGYGRILFTSSAAGLYGNFGQTNYAAAKMGLVGFMNSLKREAEKYGVTVNTVAPVAATRLTQDILPPDLLDRMKPEFVVPLVLYLCSEECSTSGKIYNAGMGHFNRVAIGTGPGIVVGDARTPPSAEAVAAAMDQITSLEGTVEFPNALAALTGMMDSLRAKTHDISGKPAEELTIQRVFENFPKAFLREKAAGVDAIFQFDISGSQGGVWHVVIRNEECTVFQGAHERPTTTIGMSDDDFLGLISGKLNAMSAYTSGKLKIGGDLMKSQLIEKLFRF